ncbi:MAG: BatA and WFA domain-containing protein [Desulfosporosinus sp.]|nr:BatA and WFA domain-containing protein [Desulfosporosinus sp.]
MQFLAPFSLVFSLIIPVIIVFYLLKQKKQQQTVSSTMLWQKALADTISQTPWQKLRRNLLLFIQLLLALLLVWALTRPFFVREQQAGASFILLVDTSTSMMSKEEGGTRMELAKAEAEKLIKAQSNGTKFTLIGVGSVPEILANQVDRQEVLNKLQGIQTGYQEGNLDNTLSLVSALLEKGTMASVIFYSDGGVILPEGPVGVKEFQYKRIGTREDNLAIGAFSWRDGPEGAVAMTRIDNYGAEEQEVTVNLLSEGKTLDVQAVKVEPGKPGYLFWPVPKQTSYLEARIEEKDALDVDNIAWLVPHKNDLSKVLLVTEGDSFLEQVLKLNPLLEVHKVKAEGYSGVKDKYDLYVFDGFWPEKPPEGQLLVFNPPASSGLSGEKEGSVTEKLQPALEQPLLDHVSWADVHVAKSKDLKLPTDGQALLKSGERTMLAIGKVDRVRAAIFGFDLHQSDLPLRAAFPILIQNLTNWLLPGVNPTETLVKIGTPWELSVRPQVDEVNLYQPDGQKIPLAPPFPIIKATDKFSPGLYKLEQVSKGEKELSPIAVNYSSPQESQVKPVVHLLLGKKDLNVEVGTNVVWEFWPWVVLMVLLLLAVEWWVYLCGH